jgi:hypothetical protein
MFDEVIEMITSVSKRAASLNDWGTPCAPGWTIELHLE